MNRLAIVVAVAGLTAACSSSTAERPSTRDEQRDVIARRDPSEPVARDGIEQPRHHESSARHSDSAEADYDQDEADSDRGRADENASEQHEADNTGRNERDDEPGSLTALDQSNSDMDLQITQAIRKKVIADDALSFNAKNVKIITVGGKVTLKGPVESARESKAIEKSARAVAGVVQVDNQIEVEP